MAKPVAPRPASGKIEKGKIYDLVTEFEVGQYAEIAFDLDTGSPVPAAVKELS